jgi:hypothetical protein
MPAINDTVTLDEINKKNEMAEKRWINSSAAYPFRKTTQVIYRIMSDCKDTRKK